MGDPLQRSMLAYQDYFTQVTVWWRARKKSMDLAIDNSVEEYI